MNIVYATRAAIPYPSAASINTVQMCDGLAALGHRVTLAIGYKFWRSPSPTARLWDYYGLPPTFDVQRFFELPRCGAYFDRCVLRLAQRQNALLYLRYPRLLAAALQDGLPTIFEMHAAPDERTLEQLKHAWPSASLLGIVVLTERLRSTLLQQLGRLADPSRVLVAPDAVKVDRFQSSRFQPSAVSLSHPPRVGYVGSLYPGKGMEIILPLAATLPQVSFLVFGGRAKELRHWRRQMGSWPNLRLYGNLAPRQVPDCMQQFEIALCPNQPRMLLPCGDDIGAYTSPLKLFEYMAAGKAIIASDLPNLREVLTHERNCLLVAHDDVHAWAAAVTRLQQDHSLRQRLGQQAQTDAQQNHSYTVRFRRILSHLAGAVSTN